MVTDEFAQQVNLLKEGLQAMGTAVGLVTETLATANTRMQELLDMMGEVDPEPAELTLTAKEVKPGSVLVEWSTTLEATQWRAGRDRQDTVGSGPWSATLPSWARSQQFNLLKPDTAYVFTVTAEVGSTTVTRTITFSTSKPTTPPPSTSKTAAERYGWGSPHPISDEFPVDGRPDPEKWILPGPGGWDGHNGNGRRMPENVYVKDGMMVLRGDANGNTGWVRQKLPTRFGRWEIRSRSRNTGSSGGLYHPLHLIWPFDEQWPANGELDFVEYTNPDSKTAGAWLHYPHPKSAEIQQAGPFEKPCDMTQFHNFAFEWNSTGVRAWIDSEPWYEVRDGAGPSGRKNIQDMTSGRLTCQLDNFTGDGGLRPALFEIEWVRFYPV
jgi:hypothetical protein